MKVASVLSVHVKTLGCKVNTYDSRVIESELGALGYKIVDGHEEMADVTVLNSCSVTHQAEVEARRLLRRYRRLNPRGTLVVTGCYAQTDSARLLQMPEIDLVIPNEGKDGVAQYIHELMGRRLGGDSEKNRNESRFPEAFKPVSENRQGHFKSSLSMVSASKNQTRAFLKIQDGCNGFCTYCIIPYARGASRSVPEAQVEAEVRRLIAEGVKEIVFTGIHLGDYGKDLGASNGGFVQLMRKLLSWPDMPRVRVSSLEPAELSEDLLRVFQERPEKFCDHFHLPLQSGDDVILKKMRRTYDTQAYAEKVSMAREYFPSANIGADLIPGFPGEDEASFERTMDFVKSNGIQYLHVFPYSPRARTPAVRFPHQVDPKIIKERARALRAFSEKQMEIYRQQSIGKRLCVLWEQSFDESSRRIGKSGNFLEVVALSETQPRAGVLDQVLVTGIGKKGRLLGVVQPQDIGTEGHI